MFASAVLERSAVLVISLTRLGNVLSEHIGVRPGGGSGLVLGGDDGRVEGGQRSGIEPHPVARESATRTETTETRLALSK